MLELVRFSTLGRITMCLLYFKKRTIVEALENIVILTPRNQISWYAYSVIVVIIDRTEGSIFCLLAFLCPSVTLTLCATALDSSRNLSHIREQLSFKIENAKRLHPLLCNLHIPYYLIKNVTRLPYWPHFSHIQVPPIFFHQKLL